MSEPGISTRRRLIWPLLTLAVAGLLWWWGSQQHSRQSQEIRHFITQFLQDAAAGRDTPSFPAAQTHVGSLALKQVRSLTAEHPNDPVTFEIIRGDISGFDDGSANYSVMLVAGSRPLIGLRIAHHGDANHIEIVGYWTP